MVIPQLNQLNLRLNLSKLDLFSEWRGYKVWKTRWTSKSVMDGQSVCESLGKSYQHGWWAIARIYPVPNLRFHDKSQDFVSSYTLTQTIFGKFKS